MTKKRQVLKFILLLKCVYKTSLIKYEQTNKKPNKALGKKIVSLNRLRRTQALILFQSKLSLDNMY